MWFLILEILCPGWMLPVTGFHLHHKSLKAAYGVRSSAVYSSSDIIGLEHLTTTAAMQTVRGMMDVEHTLHKPRAVSVTNSDSPMFNIVSTHHRHYTSTIPPTWVVQRPPPHTPPPAVPLSSSFPPATCGFEEYMGANSIVRLFYSEPDCCGWVSWG